MRTEYEIGQAIGRIEQTCRDIDEQVRLMTPLVDALLPIAIQMDEQSVLRSGRGVEMSKQAYPEQFKAGINKVMGFEILWV